MNEKKITKKTSDFIQSYECLNACLTNYLVLQGKRISPSDIFFSGIGFDFMCVEKDGKQQLLSNMYKSSFTYMDKVGIKYRHSFYTNDSEKMHFIVREITINKSIIALKIHSNYLKYNRVYSQTAAMHYIDVVDYNEENQEFFIIDGDVPTTIPSTFSGWVNANELIEGWEKTNCEYIIFIDCNNAKVISSKEMIFLVKNQLIEYCNSENKGYSALKKYFKNLEVEDDEQLAMNARETNYQIKVEGIWASRYYLLDFLLSLNINDEHIAKMKEIIKQWNTLCLSLIKLSISKRVNEKEKIALMVSDILINEEEYFNNLIFYLSKLCSEGTDRIL